MADFNPYTDFKYSGSTGSNNLDPYFDPSSGGSSGIGTGSDSWQKALSISGDPFGLDQSKKKSPFLSDFLPFAGQRLSEFAKGRYGQGMSFGSGDLKASGGGGVSQSGDLTIVYPQSPQVIPAQGGGLGSTIGSIAGAALGTLIAPGIGTSIGGQLGGAAGSFF